MPVHYRVGINGEEWYGYFMVVHHCTTMEEIEAHASDLLDHSDGEEIYVRVYYRDYDEKNHIGFVVCTIADGEYQYRHLTADRQPLVFHELDPKEFYTGQQSPAQQQG